MQWGIFLLQGISQACIAAEDLFSGRLLSYFTAASGDMVGMRHGMHEAPLCLTVCFIVVLYLFLSSYPFFAVVE